MKTGSEFARSMSFIQKRKWVYFTGMIGMTAMFAALPVIQAVILKKMIEAAEFQSISYLLESVYFLAASLMFICIFVPVFCFMYNSSAKQTAGDVQEVVFMHRSQLPVQYFEEHHSGELVSRITNDVTTMTEIYTGRLRRLIHPVVYGITAAVPMFILDWRISSGLVLLNSFALYLNTRFTKPMRKVSREIQKSLAALSEKMVDMLAGSVVMKMFGIRPLILQKFRAENETAAKKMIRREILDASLASLNHTLGMLSMIVVLTVGVMLVSYEQSTFGTVFALLFLQTRLSRAFLEVGIYIPEVQKALAGSERVFEFLDEAVEPEKYGEGEVNNARDDNSPYITIQDVTFSYKEDQPSLKGLTLSVEKGTTVSLVGPSGGGKSTILKILMGFYPQGSGTILIAGKELGSWSLQQLRDLIAYVPQEPYLFDATIEENIAYGNSNAEPEEIVQAAKAAFAHDFIMQLPNGYKSFTGERGNRLSGGQRQRIAIARAVLKNAPILLLDEATSALDSESEKWVQQALNHLMKDRTTICIAHKLSTIEESDKIYVIDDGAVIEEGSHAELLDNSMLYKQMYEKSNLAV